MIVAAFDHTDPALPVEERVALGVKRCGVSVSCEFFVPQITCLSCMIFIGDCRGSVFCNTSLDTGWSDLKHTETRTVVVIIAANPQKRRRSLTCRAHVSCTRNFDVG